MIPLPDNTGDDDDTDNDGDDDFDDYDDNDVPVAGRNYDEGRQVRDELIRNKFSV